MKIKKIITFSVLFLAIAGMAVFSYYQKIWPVRKNLKIAVVADIHRCSPSGALAENDLSFKTFLDDIRAHQADVIINLGDLLSYRVGRCEETADHDLEQTIRFFSQNFPLFYNVIGDHDVDGPESLESWKKINNRENTYYTVDLDKIKLIILDTVTGGENVAKKCEDDENCQKIKMDYELFRDKLNNENEINTFLVEYKMSRQEAINEKNRLKKMFSDENEKRKKSRSFDGGKISDIQLAWLENELKKSKSEIIIIAGHHPVYVFNNGEKNYSIQNGDELEKILHDSGKKIIALSGDAHSWHEEIKSENINFYIIDRFSTSSGQLSWAVFNGGENGFTLEKVIR